MSERDLFEAVAAEEGWQERTQINILLRYIETQCSSVAFADFIAQTRADPSDGDYPNDPDDGHDHLFDDEELDLSGNGSTLICTRCGMLSAPGEQA